MNGKFAARALACGILAASLTAIVAAQQIPDAGITETDIPTPGQAPPPPPLPPRPADASPKPPAVSCTAGQLTISAENSTIGSVLTAVQNCIGVKFEIPAGSHEERTFLHLGPGTTRTVLLALLESTDYDYVLEPSASDPASIHAVLLMPRTSTNDKEVPARGELALTPARRAWLAARRNGRPPSSDDPDAQQAGDEPSAPSEAVEIAPDPTPAAPVQTASSADAPPAQVAPADAAGSVPPDASAGAPAASGANDSGSSDPFRSQITSMQQMFQQRQQMIQTENKVTPSATPQSSTPQ